MNDVACRRMWARVICDYISQGGHHEEIGRCCNGTCRNALYRTAALGEDLLPEKRGTDRVQAVLAEGGEGLPADQPGHAGRFRRRRGGPGEDSQGRRQDRGCEEKGHTQKASETACRAESRETCMPRGRREKAGGCRATALCRKTGACCKTGGPCRKAGSCRGTGAGQALQYPARYPRAPERARRRLCQMPCGNAGRRR